MKRILFLLSAAMALAMIVAVTANAMQSVDDVKKKSNVAMAQNFEEEMNAEAISQVVATIAQNDADKKMAPPMKMKASRRSSLVAVNGIPPGGAMPACWVNVAKNR